MKTFKVTCPQPCKREACSFTVQAIDIFDAMAKAIPAGMCPEKAYRAYPEEVTPDDAPQGGNLHRDTSA